MRFFSMLALLLLTALLLTACSKKLVPTFYRLDVRQGNVIEQDRVQRLQLGMSKRQVAVLLGTPLIVDPFHQQRWDYVYVYYPSGNEKKGQEERLALFFDGDLLARVDAAGLATDPGEFPIAPAGLPADLTGPDGLPVDPDALPANPIGPDGLPVDPDALPQ